MRLWSEFVYMMWGELRVEELGCCALKGSCVALWAVVAVWFSRS